MEETFAFMRERPWCYTLAQTQPPSPSLRHDFFLQAKKQGIALRSLFVCMRFACTYEKTRKKWEMEIVCVCCSSVLFALPPPWLFYRWLFFFSFSRLGFVSGRYIHHYGELEGSFTVCFTVCHAVFQKAREKDWRYGAVRIIRIRLFFQRDKNPSF